MKFNPDGSSLNDSKVPKDFFGPNITVHAIVGENGSGKSSLLDLMYRLINNFSFMLELGMHKSAGAMNLCYVQGLRMNLHFILDGQKGVLHAFDDEMSFQYADYDQTLTFNRVERGIGQRVIFDNINIKDEVIKEATVTAPVARMAEVARRFFYTIVSNYSIQSYIDDDYANEKTLIEYHPELEEGKGGKKQISRNVIERDEGDVWIHNIFHKNDGYRTPIVLNPYRGEGVLDMGTEYRLAIYRLSSVFLKARQLHIDLLDEYSFQKIDYTYDAFAVERKFEKQFNRKVRHQAEWVRMLNIKDSILSDSETIGSRILHGIGLSERTDIDKHLVRDACLYMVYKVLSIASKYPSYYEFEDFGNIESYFQRTDDIRTPELLTALLDTIEKDRSHITIKYRQMKKFLTLVERDPEALTWLFDTFTYDQYINALVESKVLEKYPRNMQDILESLPPAFFNIDIMLVKKDEQRVVNLRRSNNLIRTWHLEQTSTRMERILINDEVEKYAKMYKTAFRAYGYDVPGKLRALKNELNALNSHNHLTAVELAQYQGYLEEVASDYDNADPAKNLLVLMPDDIDIYVKKYDKKYLNLKLDRDLVYKVQAGGKNPGPKKKKFWELIVDIMHYENDIRPLMIPIIEALGIKACVYCNVQYALTINHNKGMFELDHRYPKSKFPFLCTSFFNLQPSCPSCNYVKKTATADFGLYTTDKAQLKPFHLLTNPQIYFRKRRLDAKLISVHMVASDVHDPKLVVLANNHQKDFNIDAMYNELTDVAEETMWRCRAYDNTYKELFLNHFPELYDKDALHRFIFGTYADGNVHKRPLTKLIRDIEEDMKVVVTP